MSRVPRIRFKGFEEDWEQRKFGELFLEKRDKTEIEDEDILLSCAITGIYLNSELFSHFRGTSNIGYLKIKKNDLILSAQNLHLGNANVNLLFEHGIISPAYKVYELNKCDQYFVQSWVKKDSTKDFFSDATTEGASQCRKNIDWCILNNQLIAIPSLYEQIRIGKLFHCLDHLITLHQRKLEKLKIIKKSMLENLFPQNGEKTPKIRFSGFTKDWEQRKLINCLSLLKDGTHGTHKDYPSGPLLLSAKNIKNGRVYYDETDRRISYKDFEKIYRNFKLQIGDILLTIVGSIGETALLKDSFEITFQRSVAFLRAKDNILPEFLMSEFNTGRFRNELEDRKSTSAQPGIYLGDLGEIPVFVSKNPAEQRRVGSYFESLDHLITLHQSKLEKLQKIKKSMLESMFV